MTYDYETNNKSFLKVHEQLKAMGIQNNAFMLQLNDPILTRINPFDPDLQDEEKYFILKECQSNFWYFLREILSWPLGDNTFAPTKLDRGNTAMLWNTLHGVSTWRTNIRQTCSDLTVSSILLWNLLNKSSSSSKIVSKDPIIARNKLKDIFELSTTLPKFISSAIISAYSDTNYNRIEFVKNALNQSELRVLSIPVLMGNEQAPSALCGDNSDIIFFHTSEFIQGLERLIDYRNPVLFREPNKRINIFNSSYGRPDQPTTTFSQNYIEGMLKWRDAFYDCDIDEYRRVINKYSNGVVYIKNSYLELGYDDKWFSAITKNMSSKNIKREILLQRV